MWGSWYDPASGQWGFACCHSTIHLSYCTGESGIYATQESSAKHLLASSSAAVEDDAPEASSSKANHATVEDRKKKAEELFSKKRLGEGDLKLDEKRLADAMQAERDRKRKGRADEEEGSSKRKKAADSYEVTEEELGTLPVVYMKSVYLRGA